MSGEDVLPRLVALIDERKRLRPSDSYVVSLLDAGLAAIAAKLREEAEELIEASGADDPEHTAHEAADLLFHFCVLLAHSDVTLGRVLTELESRFGVGGFEEKSSRDRDRGHE
jgi:phosphoribosyl-ATP pyrophosphohydrolase